MKRLNILLADDHHTTLTGLRTVLESQEGWRVCGEATNGPEAVEKAKHLQPDVVVMDFGLSGMNGVEATRRIRDSLPDTEVVILTMHKLKTLAREALAAGARGFVLKTERNRQLVEAVKMVAEHKVFYSAEALETALPAIQDNGSAGASAELPHPSLTARECEVIRMIADGKRSKEIAATLKISAKTVDVHKSHISRKLNLHSTAELVRYAIRTRLAEL